MAIGLAVLAAAFLVMQAFGGARTNPSVDPSLRLEAQTTVAPDVAGIVRRACYDCHSNETRWPWYSRVAPARWLVVHDVDEGRGQLNFSTWGEYNVYDRADMLDEACKLTTEGKMPLRPYLLLHPEARLTPQEIEGFCAWTKQEAERLTSGGTQ
jgi:hypothetical protein